MRALPTTLWALTLLVLGAQALARAEPKSVPAAVAGAALLEEVTILEDLAADLEGPVWLHARLVRAAERNEKSGAPDLVLVAKFLRERAGRYADAAAAEREAGTHARASAVATTALSWRVAHLENLTAATLGKEALYRGLAAAVQELEKQPLAGAEPWIPAQVKGIARELGERAARFAPAPPK